VSTDATSTNLSHPVTQAEGPTELVASRLVNRKRDLQTFLASLLLYGLVLLPVLLADRYHLEDLRRLIRGAYGWVGEGRPLTELLMRILNIFGPMTDIAPIPQLAGISLLAYTSVWISRRFSISSPIQAALAALPLGASPFFLENLSFRFDSLCMCLSIVLALVPVLVLQRFHWITSVIGALCLVASLCLYQTGINAFLVFSVTELVLAQLEGLPFARLSRLAFQRLFQAIGALVVYVLLAKLVVAGPYNVEHFEYVNKFSELPIVKQNWDAAWLRIYHSLPGTLRNIFIFPVWIALFIIVYSSIVYLNKCSREKSDKLRFAIIGAGLFVLPSAWFTASLGPILFPIHALITLPRIFIGTGALLASAFVMICAATAKWRRSNLWVSLFLGVPGYTMIMLASIYGNAQVEQGRYEERIGSRLSFDLKQLAGTHTVNELIVQGIVPFCPIVRKATDRYNLLRVQRNLYDDRGLAEYAHHIYEYYGIDLKPEFSDERRSALIDKSAKTEPIVHNADYDIRLVEDVAVVSLSGDQPTK
jgi:hypothetical protein